MIILLLIIVLITSVFQKTDTARAPLPPLPDTRACLYCLYIIYCVYMYVCVYLYMCVYIYIYTHTCATLILYTPLFRTGAPGHLARSCPKHRAAHIVTISSVNILLLWLLLVVVVVVISSSSSSIKNWFLKKTLRHALGEKFKHYRNMFVSGWFGFFCMSRIGIERRRNAEPKRKLKRLETKLYE